MMGLEGRTKSAIKGAASFLAIFSSFLTVFLVGSTKGDNHDPHVGLRAATTVYADSPVYTYAQSFYQGAYGGSGGGGDGGGGGGGDGCDDDGGDDDGDDDDG